MRPAKPKHLEPKAATIARIEAAYFSGPLPPPNLLAQYNDVIPNGADRILAMAERQSAHREALESQVVLGNLESQRRGSIFAFILALIVVLAGVSLMAMGKNVWGFAAIITSLATLTGVFIYSKSGQRKERAEKLATLNSKRSK